MLKEWKKGLLLGLVIFSQQVFATNNEPEIIALKKQTAQLFQQIKTVQASIVALDNKMNTQFGKLNNMLNKQVAKSQQESTRMVKELEANVENELAQLKNGFQKQTAQLSEQLGNVARRLK